MTFQINHVFFNQKKYRLTQENQSEKNKYTIIIGKNGIGKTRLLCEIINIFRVAKKNEQFDMPDLFDTRISTISKLNVFNYNQDIYTKNKNSLLEYINYTYKLPKKIIASSTSPFEKFQFEPELYLSTNHRDYHYLGIRNRNNKTSVSSSLINNFVDNIISKSHSKIEKSNLENLFNLLGYQPVFGIKYGSILSINAVSELLSLYIYKCEKNYESFIDLLKSSRDKSHIKYEIFFKDLLENNQDEYKSDTILKELNYIKNHSTINIKNDVINIFLSDENETKNTHNSFLRNTEIIRNSGLLRTIDINLTNNEGETYNIKDLSSGQQSILLTILGIAGVIENNSLICIDEPEICLHPEWQEQFISLLIKVFSTYSGCHFLIATHSPQIVSNLSEDNCYILTMEDGVLHDAKDFINRSADFQLATLFHSPGQRNEYLNRESVNMLSKISKAKKIKDIDFEKAKELINTLPLLEDGDPVKELIEIIKISIDKIKYIQG